MSNVLMDEITRVVSLQLGIRDVTASALLVEELGAESADVINIIAVLEEKYQILVKESDIAKIRKPVDLFELVLKKKGGG